jgi:tripartite-type tricarboxylate transporter receptor subunit TctC
LAVTSAELSALAPDLPTVASSGVPGYESVGITGIWAPAKTPEAIITRLNQEIIRLLGLPDVKKRLLSADVESVGSSPEEFAAMIRSDMANMGKVIKDANIKLE